MPTESSATIKDHALALSLGMRAGIVSAEDVVAWADQVIDQEDHPDQWIIELSLAGRKIPQDLFSLLNKAPGSYSKPICWILFCRIAQAGVSAGAITLQKLASFLYEFSHEGVVPQEEVDSLLGFELDYDSCGEGHGKHASVDRAFMSYLRGITSRHNMPNRIKRKASTARKLVILIGAIAFLFLLGKGFADWRNPFNDRAFISKEWKQSHPRIRAAMAQDLMDFHLPPGLSPEEVETLLGQPTVVRQTEAENREGIYVSQTYSYDLWGWDIKEGYDSTFLFIPFNREGLSIESYIWGY